jgi:hypothetical protein
VAAFSVHRVLGAVCDRVDVARCSADSIAGGDRQGDAEQNHSRQFLDHLMSPSLTAIGNAALPERLHNRRVLFGAPLAEWTMRITGLAAIVMLCGCVSHGGVRPLRPLEIATAPYQQVAISALPGSLMYEGGCLLFHDEQSGLNLMPVWPIGSSFNGTAVLFHQPGRSDQWVAVAQELLIEGQPIGWPTLKSLTYQPFQHQCGGFTPFFISAVRPAN